MKTTQILLLGVILGFCLGQAAAAPAVLKKVTPPISDPQQDQPQAAETKIDPLEMFNSENEPDPRPFTPPNHYLCLQAQRAIVIDGRLNETEWQKTLWSETFGDIRAPYGSSRPVPPTKFKMLWDDNYLYIAAYLSEYNILAKESHRDGLKSPDYDLEMYLDINADSQQYLVLKINAYNALQTLLYNRPPKDGGIARLWPIEGIDHAVFVEGTLNKPGDRDQCWQVEMAIPLKLGGIGRRPAGGETWRINFARVERRSNLILTTDIGNYTPQQLAAMEQVIRCCWTPQGVINMHRPETWGYLQFYTLPAGSPAFFEPDPTEWARYTLHKVLYAQKWYYANNSSYANSMDLLGLDKTPPLFATEPIQIEVGPDTFRASVQLRMPDMTIRTISIDQQAKVILTPD